ncbi:MAG: DUF1572 family protein [Chryseolinea sp.]
MIADTLKILFRKDLIKLKSELAQYTNEENIWRIDKDISNSAGNLCLHLIGNLNAYIGVGLAKTNYVRQRDLEFSSKGVPREHLLKDIDETMLTVESGLSNLADEQMAGAFPLIIWEQPMSVVYTLLHLQNHLSYHLGQINYHRRMLDA